MQRALRELVKTKVLKIKAAPGKGETVEYALVDEARLTEEESGSGSNPDMPTVSNPDEGGSKSDMPGSEPDLSGSKSDMGGSNPDNNTILIENPLVDPRLKDPSYVEPGLPRHPKNTPEPDKLKGVKSVHPFRSIQASGTHTPNPMSSKGAGSSESAKSQKSQGSSVSSGQGLVAASLPSAPTSRPPSGVPGFKKSTRVQLSDPLEAQFYKYTKALRTMNQVTAKSAVTVAMDWVTSLFKDSKPEQLIEFLKIHDQSTLYDKLAEFFEPHLAKHLERFLNTPERKLLAQFSSQLVMQFLTQAFCQYDDDKYIPVASVN
jgi:hypothetical protein